MENKVVIVTGSSSGIGEATAKMFAREGAKVVVNSRSNPEEGKRVASEIENAGGTAIHVQADVGKYEQASKLILAAVNEFGRLDILINNAGVGVENDFLELDQESIELLMADNLMGTIYCSQAAVKVMNDQDDGGKILNTSSIRGWQWGGRAPIYAAAKAGVNNFTTSLARMYSPKIMINAVAPGFTKTPSYDGRNEEQVKSFLEQSKTKQWIEPEEIAEAFLFLAKSKSITGEVIYVDGGYRAG